MFRFAFFIYPLSIAHAGSLFGFKTASGSCRHDIVVPVAAPVGADHRDDNAVSGWGTSNGSTDEGLRFGRGGNENVFFISRKNFPIVIILIRY